MAASTVDVSSWRRARRAVVLVIAALMLIAPHDVVVAQGGTITGVASDVRGQRLPGVTVTATPQSGGVSWHTRTGSDGRYRFDGLPDNTYRVDFDLRNFVVVRRNHVRVGRDKEVNIDAVLPLRALCECVTLEPPNPWAQRVGQVIDKAGHPLPHARVDLIGRQTAYTDSEGRFLIRVPVDDSWPLTATDTGFRGKIDHVSGSDAASVVVVMEFVGAVDVRDVEHFAGCECDGYLRPYGAR